MSLFTINRYMGEVGGGEEEELKTNHAQYILEKIHQHAQLRKHGSLSAAESLASRNRIILQVDSESNSGVPGHCRQNNSGNLKCALKKKGSAGSDGVVNKTKVKKLKTAQTPTVTPKKKANNEKCIENKGESTPQKMPSEKLIKKTPNVTHKASLKRKAKTQEQGTTKEKPMKTANKSRRKSLKKKTITSVMNQTESSEKEEGDDNVKPTQNKIKKRHNKNRETNVKHSTSDSSDEDEVQSEGESKSVAAIEECETGHETGNSEDPEGKQKQNKNMEGFTVIGDVRKKKVEKVQRVLPEWLANPSLMNNDLKDTGMGLDTVSGLDQDLLDKLRENGINHFFPVQRLVIPVLLSGHITGHLIGHAGYRPSDICCSAPTGSGKTLAFILPIIQTLRDCVVRQVRALVVLPVRDLASQVYRVFSIYCKGTNIKVGLLIGQKSFKNEQQTIVRKGPRGPQVQADIVVATPGRLVDHIKDTQGFHLHHLRYLVIDEADRMMDNIKQDWLSQVEQAVYGGESTRPHPASLSAIMTCRLEMPLQKLLFSATLSQNPEKLQQLKLFHPKMFTAVVETPHPSTTIGAALADTDKEATSKLSAVRKREGDFVGKFSTPAGLSEYLVMAREAGEKPLLLLYFLHQRKFRHMLVFTNSVEATHRLYHLIKLVGGLEVAEFSSSLHAMQRNKILKKFAAGKIHVLICSDAMARGMDVENVQCVLSYDHVPYVKTYIHRIGRTARAGKVGTAFTLLEKNEVFNFKKMVREAGKEKVRELKISKSDLHGLLPHYQRALQTLPSILQFEKNR